MSAESASKSVLLSNSISKPADASSFLKKFHKKLESAQVNRSATSFDALIDDFELLVDELRNSITEVSFKALEDVQLSQNQNSLSLFSAIRDLLSINLDILIDPFIKANLLSAFCRIFKLKKLSFVALLCQYLTKISSSLKDWLNGAKNAPSSLIVESFQMLQTLSAQTLFQYCNVANDINSDDYGALFQWLKVSEQGIPQYCALFGLISYAERSRLDFQKEMQKAGSWNDSLAQNAFVFAACCFNGTGSEDNCTELITQSNVMSFYLLSLSEISAQISSDSKNGEFYKFTLHSAREFFIKFVTSSHRIIRKIRVHQEKIAEASQSTTGDISFSILLRILTVLFKHSSDSIGLWWDKQAKLHPFLRWTAESTAPLIIADFIFLLKAILDGSSETSTDLKAYTIAFEMISTGYLSNITWNVFFDALEKYSISFSQAGAFYPGASGASGLCINPEEYKVIVAFSQLTYAVTSKLSDARNHLFQQKHISSIVSLISSPVSVELKAHLIDLLAGFAVDSQKAATLSAFLHKSQALNGIVLEIQQVELRRQQSYAETIAFLNLCVLLCSVDHTIPMIVFEKIFCGAFNRRYNDNPNEKWIVFSKCLEVFCETMRCSSHIVLQGTPIADRLIANANGCIDLILEQFSETCLGFNDYFKTFAFFALQLFCGLLECSDSPNVHFIDVLISRDTRLLNLFKLIEDPANSNISFYILKLFDAFVRLGSLDKLSQLLLPVELCSKQASNVAPVENEIINGFVHILRSDGPMIASDSSPLVFSSSSIDYSFVIKRNLLLLMKSAVSMHGKEYFNFFISFFCFNDNLKEALLDVVESSPYPSFIEFALEIVAGLLGLCSDECSSILIRYLRTKMDFITYLIREILSQIFAFNPSSSESNSRCTLITFGNALRIIGYDLFSLFCQNASCDDLIKNLSFVDLSALFSAFILKENMLALDAFEFFMKMLLSTAKEALPSVVNFIRQELSAKFSSFLLGIESPEILVVLCRILYDCSEHLSFKTGIFKIFEESSSLKIGRFNVASRVALYSSLIKITVNSADSGVKYFDHIERSELFNSLLGDAISSGAVQIFALALLETLMQESDSAVLSVSKSLHKTGVLTRLIEVSFADAGKESAEVVGARRIAIFHLLALCSTADDGAQALVDAGFIEGFGDLCQRELSKAFSIETFILLVSICTECFKRVTKASIRYENFKIKFKPVFEIGFSKCVANTSLMAELSSLIGFLAIGLHFLHKSQPQVFVQDWSSIYATDLQRIFAMIADQFCKTFAKKAASKSGSWAKNGEISASKFAADDGVDFSHEIAEVVWNGVLNLQQVHFLAAASAEKMSSGANTNGFFTK